MSTEMKYVAIPDNIDGGLLWPNLDGELRYCVLGSTPMYVSQVAIHFPNEYKTPYKAGSILTVPGADAVEAAKLIAAGKAKMISVAQVREQLRRPGCMVDAYTLKQYRQSQQVEPLAWSRPFW